MPWISGQRLGTWHIDQREPIVASCFCLDEMTASGGDLRIPCTIFSMSSNILYNYLSSSLIVLSNWISLDPRIYL